MRRTTDNGGPDARQGWQYLSAGPASARWRLSAAADACGCCGGVASQPALRDDALPASAARAAFRRASARPPRHRRSCPSSSNLKPLLPCREIVSRSASSASTRARLEDFRRRLGHRAAQSTPSPPRARRRRIRCASRPAPGAPGRRSWSDNRRRARATPEPAAASANTTRPRPAGIDGRRDPVLTRLIDEGHRRQRPQHACLLWSTTEPFHHGNDRDSSFHRNRHRRNARPTLHAQDKSVNLPQEVTNRGSSFRRVRPP